MANISIPVLGSLFCNLDIRSLGRVACVNKTWRAAANSKQIEQELGRREGEALPPEKLKEFINRLPTLGCVLSRQTFTRQNDQVIGRAIRDDENLGMSLDNGEIFTPAWAWDGKALRGVVKVWSLNLQHLRDLPTKHIELKERDPKPVKGERRRLGPGLHEGWKNPIVQIAVCGNTLATLGQEGRIDLSSREDGRLLRSISVGEMDARASYCLALDTDTIYFGNKGIRSWATATGEPKHAFLVENLMTNFVVNGRKIYASTPDGMLFVYDKETGKLDTAQKTAVPMRALARGRLFCSGLEGLLVGINSPGEVLAYETTRLSPLWKKTDEIWHLGTDGLDPFVCIRDGKRFTNRLEIWNGATGAKKATLCEEIYPVQIAAFGPIVYVLEVSVGGMHSIVSYNFAPPPPQPQKPAR